MDSKRVEVKNSVNAAYKKSQRKDMFVHSAFQTVMTELWIFYIRKSKANGRMEAEALNDMKETVIGGFRDASLETHQRSIPQYEEWFNKEVQHMLEFAGSRNGGGNTISKGDTIIHQSNGLL